MKTTHIVRNNMSKSVSEAYPELYHYTGITGLTGILKTQTLRATHCRYLNDGEEIKHYEQRLARVIRPDVASGVAELVRQAPENQAIIAMNGGVEKSIDDSTSGISSALYKATFIGENDEAPFAEPYITSFCAIDKTWKKEKREQIAKHGLLSQWQGYGKRGGYAIVFDTDRLGQLLHQEHPQNSPAKWHYQNEIVFGDVVYSNASDQDIPEDFIADENAVKEGIRSFLHEAGINPGVLERTYDPFCRCACRYKHWGFEEEQEVRTIAVPASQKVRNFAAAGNIGIPAQKPINHFTRAGVAVPYIELFKEITVPGEVNLPIKRIIVGPHPDKVDRKRSLELMLKEKNIGAEVLVSDIPYIEMGD